MNDISKLTEMLDSASGGKIGWVVCSENTMRLICDAAGVEYNEDWGTVLDLGEDVK